MHDERHFVETYSLRQVWEVDLHPEEGCGGPLDLHLALDVDPRVLLSFEDAVVLLAEDEEPVDEFHFPLTFTWALPPLPSGPDLLRLAIDLAGVGGIELPLEVSAIDSFANATDGSERRLSIVARHPVSLARVLSGEELLCDVFDRGTGREPIPARVRRTLAGLTWRDGRRRAALRALALAAIVAGSAVALSACSGAADGQSLARQACVHVRRSVGRLPASPPRPARLRRTPHICRTRPIKSCGPPSPGRRRQLRRRLVELAHDDHLGECHRGRGSSRPLAPGAVCRRRHQPERQSAVSDSGNTGTTRITGNNGNAARHHHRPSERQPRARVTRRVGRRVLARHLGPTGGDDGRHDQRRHEDAPCGVKCTPSSIVRISTP